MILVLNTNRLKFELLRVCFWSLIFWLLCITLVCCKRVLGWWWAGAAGAAVFFAFSLICCANFLFIIYVEEHSPRVCVMSSWAHDLYKAVLSTCTCTLALALAVLHYPIIEIQLLAHSPMGRWKITTPTKAVCWCTAVICWEEVLDTVVQLLFLYLYLQNVWSSTSKHIHIIEYESFVKLSWVINLDIMFVPIDLYYFIHKAVRY